MKRILTFFICLVGIYLTGWADSTAKCLLQHKGAVTIYDASAIETAIKKAVDGDTIFLSAGSFPGFTLNKKVLIRGVGDSYTKISGNIEISINGSGINQTLLSGLDLFAHTINLSSAMNGVRIEQCVCNVFSASSNNNDIIIDRCKIGRSTTSNSSNGIYYNQYIKGLTVLNSQVTVYGDTPSEYWPITYINSNVQVYYSYQISGTFINSCFFIRKGQSYDYDRFFQYCIFNNCIIDRKIQYSSGSYDARFDENSCILDNCYYASSAGFTKDEIENLGYIGNDGTIVGEYGGTTPFTLSLSVPKVKNSLIAVDKDNKVLKVSLEVSAE